LVGRRDASKKLKGVDIGADPGRQILREGDLREGIMAGTRSSHKGIRFLGLSCEGYWTGMV